MDSFQIPDTWERPEDVLHLLASQLVASRMLLVLGAGVSAGCNLPEWNELVNRAYRLASATRKPAHNTNQASDFLLNNILNQDQQRFAALISRALYDGLDEAAVLQSPLLSAIGSVLMVAARRNLVTCITYNFDDLLETFLSRHGLYAFPAIDQPCWYEQEDVTVLHPHGFLSRRASVPSSSRLTFTMTDFDRQTGRADDRWRQKTLDLLERNTPLFIGLSGDDPNLRSQLEQAQANHVAKRDGHTYWGVRICLKSDPNNDLWSSKGIWCYCVDSYSDIHVFLMSLCAAAAELLHSKYSSLGPSTVGGRG